MLPFRFLLLFTASATLAAAQNNCAQVRTRAPLAAEIGYGCLTSVPFKLQPALDTVESFKRLTQFQSTAILLKNPPQGYDNPPVDLLGLLDQVKAKATAGGYTNQYDFEADLANITVRSYDGHYTFRGNTFLGALRWTRGTGPSAALVSVSADGAALPQIYAATDLRGLLGVGRYTASPVTAINSVPVLDFLRQESLYQTFHDPDARFNLLFYRAASDSYGSFVNPWFYPGPTTTFTFANQTTKTMANQAFIPKDVSWTGVNDGDTFYTKFVDPTNEQSTTEARALLRRSLPQTYPTPVIQHSSSTLNLAGFFLLGNGFTDVAVLAIGTFNYDVPADGLEFQTVVSKFLALCKAQNKKKIIVDVSSNGGGALFLGYDTFRQFFPKTEPDLLSNMRAQEGLNVLGSQFGLITSYIKANNTVFCKACLGGGSIYLQSIHYKDSLDSNLQSFSSWQDLYGPVTVKGDQFTKMLRYNFSDPLSQTTFTVTGYGSRTGTVQPFDAANIVVLHDGYCASTCAVFSDLMRRQGGVKSYAIGGRPQTGPMQPVGGTKGALLLDWTTLFRYVLTVLYDFGTAADQSRWAKILPFSFAIQTSTPPSVNFRNAYHPGGDTAVQFLNEPANCRLFYTPSMVNDVTYIWQAVASNAWAGADSCVAGSKTNGSSSEVFPAGGSGPGTTTTVTAGAPAKTAAAGRVVPGVWAAVVGGAATVGLWMA